MDCHRKVLLTSLLPVSAQFLLSRSQSRRLLSCGLTTCGNVLHALLIGDRNGEILLQMKPPKSLSYKISFILSQMEQVCSVTTKEQDRLHLLPLMDQWVALWRPFPACTFCLIHIFDKLSGIFSGRFYHLSTEVMTSSFQSGTKVPLGDQRRAGGHSPGLPAAPAPAAHHTCLRLLCSKQACHICLSHMEESRPFQQQQFQRPP